jgi:hypothetical protein
MSIQCYCMLLQHVLIHPYKLAYAVACEVTSGSGSKLQAVLLVLTTIYSSRCTVMLYTCVIAAVTL